jgi:hypothetical protein
MLSLNDWATRRRGPDFEQIAIAPRAVVVAMATVAALSSPTPMLLVLVGRFPVPLSVSVAVPISRRRAVVLFSGGRAVATAATAVAMVTVLLHLIRRVVLATLFPVTRPVAFRGGSSSLGALSLALKTFNASWA